MDEFCYWYLNFIVDIFSIQFSVYIKIYQQKKGARDMTLFLFNLIVSLSLGVVYSFFTWDSIWNNTLTIITTANVLSWCIYLVAISDPDYYKN